jgi:hypothetical protein
LPCSGVKVLARSGERVLAAHGFNVFAAHGLSVLAAHGFSVLAAHGLIVFAAHGLIVFAAHGLIVFAAQGLIADPFIMDATVSGAASVTEPGCAAHARVAHIDTATVIAINGNFLNRKLFPMSFSFSRFGCVHRERE